MSDKPKDPHRPPVWASQIAQVPSRSYEGIRAKLEAKVDEERGRTLFSPFSIFDEQRNLLELNILNYAESKRLPIDGDDWRKAALLAIAAEYFAQNTKTPRGRPQNSTNLLLGRKHTAAQKLAARFPKADEIKRRMNKDSLSQRAACLAQAKAEWPDKDELFVEKQAKEYEDKMSRLNALSGRLPSGRKRKMS